LGSYLKDKQKIFLLIRKNVPFVYFFYRLRFVVFISSTQWFMLWAILELNSIIFIPLLNKNKTSQEHGARLTYFLTQGTASLLMIFSMFTLEVNNSREIQSPKILILLALIVKITRAPVHRWLPAIIVSLTRTNVWLVLTMQKLIPLMLLMLIKPNLNTILICCILISTTMGAIINLTQSNSKAILAYSRISHAGWFMTARRICQESWIFYFVSYTSLLFLLRMGLNITVGQHRIAVNQRNSALSLVTILSLGGLPPLMGFYPKAIIISSAIQMELNRLALVIIVLSAVDVFVYIRLSYHAIMNKKSKILWLKKEKYFSISIVIIINVVFSIIVIL